MNWLSGTVIEPLTPWHQLFPEGPLELFACLLDVTFYRHPGLCHFSVRVLSVLGVNFVLDLSFNISPHSMRPGSNCQIPPTHYVSMLLHRKIRKGRNKLRSLWNTPKIKFPHQHSNESNRLLGSEQSNCCHMGLYNCKYFFLISPNLFFSFSNKFILWSINFGYKNLF